MVGDKTVSWSGTPLRDNNDSYRSHWCLFVVSTRLKTAELEAPEQDRGKIPVLAASGNEGNARKKKEAFRKYVLQGSTGFQIWGLAC
jgi:hypothetical protein